MSVVLPEQPPVRRVREEVRDGIAVICFSAAASVAFALAMLLAAMLAGQGS